MFPTVRMNEGQAVRCDGEIAVRGLTVRYRDQPPVFDKVTFAIGRGDAVALVGANGSGKSTLLKACLGFIVPDAGDVSLFGQAVRASNRRTLRRQRSLIGFVAQQHNLVPRLSVLTNVIHGRLGTEPGPRRWLQGLAPETARIRAMDALDRVGLAHLAARRADSLSGGQSQRVAIARALVKEPRLILADEPVASLDPAAGEDVMALFVRVCRDAGATLLFTTHHVDHALAYSQRVLGLHAGELALDARSDQLDEGELRGFYARH